jgi:hypothetical protein
MPPSYDDEPPDDPPARRSRHPELAALATAVLLLACWVLLVL